MTKELPVELADWITELRRSDTPDGDAVKSVLAEKLAEAFKGRVYVDDPSKVPDAYEPQEGPRGGTFYETEDAAVNETPDNDSLWANMSGWERWARRYEHIGIERLADYLGPIPDEAQDFVTGWDAEFRNVMVDAEAGEQWNEMVEDLSPAEAVTVMFYTAMEADEDRNYRPKYNTNSNLSAHGPWAALVKRMDDRTLAHVIDWLDHADDDNHSIQRMKEAVARHAPYDVRLDRIERARSAYPYIPELATDMSAQPDPDWWDTDAEWFAEDADFETFRDHLINHWTDSPHSQGGIIAREAAAAIGENPIWDTIVPPYHGFGPVSVPYANPPGHVTVKFDRLRRQTRDYYREQGIDSLTLYRGVEGEVTTPAPLESWTDDPEEAAMYAGDDGHVMEREIPVRLIAFSHETIPEDRWDALAGYKSADMTLNEFAVLGGSGVSP